jgi:hypothetical protein
MPKRPARKGFARTEDCHRGWRDKVGLTFRPGRSVFVLVSHAEWGGVPAGKIPARLYRSFHWHGDRLGKYRLDAEYCWCLNHAMLSALGADVLAMVPETVRTAMRANPRLVVETNWAVSDAFETVTGDVAIVRPPLDLEPASIAARFPADDADAAMHVGTLRLAVTKGGALKQRRKADSTWHNYAISWRGWGDDDELDDLVPPEFLSLLPSADAEMQPIAAEYGATTRFEEVAAGGGPHLEVLGEQLRIGADESRIFGVVVDAASDGGDGGNSTSRRRHVYIDGNPYADPLTGIEMLDHAELKELSTDPATLGLLAIDDFDQRVFLNNRRELMPGWRRLTFRRSAIVAQFISVNPSLLEGASLLEDVKHLYSFEGQITPGGTFEPLRRFGERLAAMRVRRLAVERRGASLDAALGALQELLVRRAARLTALDPAEIRSNGPWPLEYVAMLPAFARMRRSPEERHVLSHVFENDADLFANVGLLAWPAPTGKERRGYLSAAVPGVAADRVPGATLQPRRVAGFRKHELNYLSYDTETRELTLRVSLARFNGSKRVRGASVGAPPSEPPAQGTVAGRPWYKYSLVERKWVPWATRAPTPAELHARYPGLQEWSHW